MVEGQGWSYNEAHEAMKVYEAHEALNVYEAHEALNVYEAHEAHEAHIPSSSSAS